MYLSNSYKIKLVQCNWTLMGECILHITAIDLSLVEICIISDDSMFDVYTLIGHSLCTWY